jgi:uncharacterized protein YgiM (DUF1202 family)
MKILFTIFLSVSYLIAVAGNEWYYVAAKNGLSVREKPEITAKVLDKIPYGQKIEANTEDQQYGQVSTEGFNGWWSKVTFNGKTGYIVNSYLLPFAPPKSETKDLKEYIAQISEPLASPSILKKGTNNEDGFGEMILTKQYYKNGAEWHDYQGYEYNSFAVILPGMKVKDAWLLLRLLKCYPELVGENETFPVKNSAISKDPVSKKITVEKETYTPTNFYIKKIKIEGEAGAIYNLEISEWDDQVLIYFNAGV